MKSNFFKFTGISKRIIVSFSILIFVIFLFQQVTTYYITYVTMRDINRSYITAGLKQKNDKLNGFFRDIDLFSKTIIANSDIQTLLVENNDDSFSISKMSHEVGYALSNTIEGIFLISEKGRIYQEAETELGEYININVSDIRNDLRQSQGEMVFFRSKFISYGSGQHGDYFFFIARKIRSIANFSDIGIMVIAIREARLWDNIAMDGDVGDYYLVDGTGEIISCNNKELIGTNAFEKLDKATQKKLTGSGNGSYVTNELVINSFRNGATGWDILNIVPISEFNANYINLQRIISTIGIIAIIIAIYISIIISRKVTHPIRDMIHSMRNVAAGNLDVQTDAELLKDSTDELKELNDVFNHMTGKLQYLINQVYEKNLREKEAELKALKAQINPHFLYNTLDTIYWMLIENGDEEIAELVTRLGEILRYSIKKGNTNVSVREEMQQIGNYLYIQKARFEDNLDYEIDIEEELYDCEMLSFLIQPFVENSINHGIMESKGKGKVIVKGYSSDKSVIFEVIDDGVGMSPEQIADVFEKSERKTGSRIGIVNVYERIKYYYGDEYGIIIESQGGSGTRVIVRIPQVKSEVEDHEA